MANIITTNSPFLNRLDYVNLNTLEKALIDKLITAMTLEIEGQCNRKFTAQDFVEVHDGDGESTIIVRNPPINSLTSISVFGDPVVVVDDADFTYDSLTGIVAWDSWDSASTADYIGIFPTGFQNITINYNGGYAVFPEDLELLVAEAVLQVFDRREATGQVQSEKLGNEYVNYGNEFFRNLLFTHKKTLSRYKRHFV